MSRYRVNHPAGLLMPGGATVSEHGSEVEVTGDNPAVENWIEAGYLVAVEEVPKQPKGKGRE